jgi:hypothetical protein
MPTYILRVLILFVMWRYKRKRTPLIEVQLRPTGVLNYESVARLPVLLCWTREQYTYIVCIATTR